MFSTLAATNKFLGTNHFIFLGISIVVIVSSLILLNKFKVSLKKVLFIVFICLILSEIIKLSEYIIPYTDETGKVIGTYLGKRGLPLHLCSIQLIFVFITLIIKEGNLRNKLLAFMYPTCFFGALLALLLATITIEFTRPLTWQYFMIHSVLVILGIYIPMSKEVELNIKTYATTCILLLGLFMLSIYINGITTMPSTDVIVNGEVVGVTEGMYTSYFYSMVPPIDDLPILNLEHGWFVYALTIMLAGIILVTLLYLPFIIKDIKLKKIQNQHN